MNHTNNGVFKMNDNFTGEIYSDWMKTTQEKKYNEILIDYILPLKNEIDFARNKTLDIGIGKAWFEKKLNERGIKANVIGVDIERTDMAVDNVDFLVADGNNLPFRDKQFNFVVSFDTIHLLKNPSEIERVMKSDGYALISIFCNEFNWIDKKKKLKSLFSNLNIIKESLVGDPKDEISYVALMKKK